jgi:hypothetical protein
MGEGLLIATYGTEIRIAALWAPDAYTGLTICPVKSRQDTPATSTLPLPRGGFSSTRQTFLGATEARGKRCKLIGNLVCVFVHCMARGPRLCTHEIAFR